VHAFVCKLQQYDIVQRSAEARHLNIDVRIGGNRFVNAAAASGFSLSVIPESWRGKVVLAP